MMNRFLIQALRHLGMSVYPFFLPADADDIYKGAETYLKDLQQQVDFSVFATQTLLALFIFFSPSICLFSFKPLPLLNEGQRFLLFSQMAESRIYWVRLAFYAVRGHAFTAILREPKAREFFGLKT